MAPDLTRRDFVKISVAGATAIAAGASLDAAAPPMPERPFGRTGHSRTTLKDQVAANNPSKNWIALSSWPGCFLMIWELTDTIRIPLWLGCSMKEPRKIGNWEN